MGVGVGGEGIDGKGNLLKHWKWFYPPIHYPYIWNMKYLKVVHLLLLFLIMDFVPHEYGIIW